MNYDNFVEILDDIRFQDYVFTVACDPTHTGFYLQASFIENDIVTKLPHLQYTRKWRLSFHMTKSEFVQTVFKCCMTSMEHRTREHFRYKGAAVYSPHFDVDALYALCKTHQFDYREPV